MYQIFDKSALLRVLGMASGAIVLLLTFVLSPETAAEWFRLLSYAATLLVLLIVAVNLVWRKLWKAIPALNSWVFPDISGEWVSSMNSNIAAIAQYHPKLQGKNPKSVVTGRIFIKQDIFQIYIRFLGADQYSNSGTIFVKPHRDKDSGRMFVYYVYQNETNRPLETDEQLHLGAARLEVTRDNADVSMSGVYWTNRNWPEGLNTAGTIMIARPDDRT